jgi:hypothetical protein
MNDWVHRDETVNKGSNVDLNELYIVRHHVQDLSSNVTNLSNKIEAIFTVLLRI